MFQPSKVEMRVAILAPLGRDASLLAGTLASLGIETSIAANLSALLEILPLGIGTAVIAEEVLPQHAIGKLGAALASQPPWSDLPLIVLSSNGRPTRESHRRAMELQALGNFTLLERPVRPETVQSSVRSALRGRMRQYEIRRSQEALIQANADLEQFAHSASHDLREPLRTIGIYSDLLQKQAADVLDARSNDFLSQIRAGVRRMDALLADLLSYAHASSITDEALESIKASGPLSHALENLSAAIRESDAKITIGELPAVRMRASHLAQVFQNLIGNAIKYRQKNKQLTIDLSANSVDGHSIFNIADNGIGIPAAYKETIFGIFKRLHSSSAYAGTGMGLAICQRIIERYRGRIWVESEFGYGSNFIFTIPA
jgi:signal transduction histidine kinase